MRYALALILLFIAPSAWGQTVGGDTGMITICDNRQEIWLDGQCRHVKAVPMPMLSNSTGTFTPPPSCDHGWTIVMQEPWGPKCAWVLKEPIYK